ncbi:MAG: putative transcriptional regulatory protein [Microgenomates group bacterium Gr01-1014_80]|nr:MAG: putative transcriptional regulatory protein [Microgenomates group bacterium Gr01-1014_80]
MSGHSKWSTIKRQKGAADIKRGQTFTKIAGAIAIAVKQGDSGDPDSNPRLRMAVEAGRAVNMPKENIQRAIERGLGKGREALEEVVYEGFGPGHVAFIVEGVTDNRLRTNQEIKSIFERTGGRLGGVGSTSYMFEKKGEIRVKSPAEGEARQSRQESRVKEEEILELIDMGAEDIEDFEEDGIQKYLVYTGSSELNTMGAKLTQAGYEIESQDLVMKPTTTQPITDPELAKKVLEFAGKLEEQDDVQKVYANVCLI